MCAQYFKDKGFVCTKSYSQFQIVQIEGPCYSACMLLSSSGTWKAGQKTERPCRAGCYPRAGTGDQLRKMNAGLTVELLLE